MIVAKLKENKQVVNTLYWILLFIVISSILTYFSNKVLYPIYAKEIGGDLPPDILEQLMESVNPNRWTKYAKKALEIIGRIAVVSGCLYAGLLFDTSIKDKRFINCWTIAVKSYIVIIALQIGLTVYNIITEQTDPDWFFASISLLRWFDGAALLESSPGLYIVLLGVNLQEVVNILFISLLVRLKMEFSFGKSVLYVLKTYGVLLLLVLLVCIIITL